MLKVVRKISVDNLHESSLATLLDREYRVDLVEQSDEALTGAFIKMQEWGNEFQKRCPKSLGKALFYICNSVGRYPLSNYVGRVALNYGWPLFFERFPLGQVWLIKISSTWWDAIWRGQQQLSQNTGYKQRHPGGLAPQEASGVLADNFPLAMMSILAYGVYPLISCAFVHTAADLILLFIPDKSFQHSQLTEAQTLYRETLWSVVSTPTQEFPDSPTESCRLVGRLRRAHHG